jgi:hypothetical protein
MTALAIVIVLGPLAGAVAAGLRARARAAGMATAGGALVSLAAAIALLAL